MLKEPKRIMAEEPSLPDRRLIGAQIIQCCTARVSVYFGDMKEYSVVKNFVCTIESNIYFRSHKKWWVDQTHHFLCRYFFELVLFAITKHVMVKHIKLNVFGFMLQMKACNATNMRSPYVPK